MISETVNRDNVVKIGVTSQNFRTITGHAGKTRRFLVFSENMNGEWQQTEQFDLPREMSMHEFKGDKHPLDTLDLLITANCGAGFQRKMSARGVEVVQTGESDPLNCVKKWIKGDALLPPDTDHHLKKHK